ncbi:MAG: MaoC family dehydratase N-terminal domain-containing protein [Deltaproteobacteria bacterium]|jgi:acyl dehydratase|nr:MaoC family dehydratase N-terminal domain-containing protein [Deltaproteobacteria bacterium]
MPEERKKTPEEILEEARKMIGMEKKPVSFSYPLEYEPIRRYCLMIDDDNPLYLDPEFAKKTRYGGVVYPPFAPFGIMDRGSPEKMANLEKSDDMIMPPTPGRYFINMAQEWEWFTPAIVGDRLTSKTRLGDVYIKPIRIDPKAFWVITETHISNQRDEKVCILKNILLCHRSPEEVAGDEP